jgi:hypothetical protein
MTARVQIVEPNCRERELVRSHLHSGTAKHDLGRSASAKLVEIIYQQGIAAPSWESADLTELFLVGLIRIFIRSYTSKHCRYC